MMWVYATAACVAFSLAVLATPLAHRLALVLGAVDLPDNTRKIHMRPTARLGGLAVAFAFFATIAATRYFTGAGTIRLWQLLIPSAVILATGVWDDVRSIRPRLKLLLQCVAALAFCALGFRSLRIGGVTVPLYVSVAASVLWLLACANALNLFDGMDGLASGFGVFASTMLFVLALYQGMFEIAIVSAGLAGACMGFLVFNFPPAVIFLGDTGSLFIGMILGVLAIEGSFKSHLTFALVVPVLALGLPLMDTLLAVLRRVSRRVPVFTADRGHIHHRLIALGFTRREALILLYSITISLDSISLVVAFSNSVVAGLFVVVGGGVIAAVARLLGASELKEFGFFIFGGLGRWRALAHYRRLLKRGVRSLERTADVDTMLSQALQDLRGLGFDAVEIEWRGRVFAAGVLPSTETAGDVWRWDSRLRATNGTEGALMIAKEGGPQDVAPEIPRLVDQYARALARALARCGATTEPRAETVQPFNGSTLNVQP